MKLLSISSSSSALLSWTVNLMLPFRPQWLYIYFGILLTHRNERIWMRMTDWRESFRIWQSLALLYFGVYYSVLSYYVVYMNVGICSLAFFCGRLSFSLWHPTGTTQTFIWPAVLRNYRVAVSSWGFVWKFKP